LVESTFIEEGSIDGIGSIFELNVACMMASWFVLRDVQISCLLIHYCFDTTKNDGVVE